MQQPMNDTATSSRRERNASVAGQRVRFLDRDPVPPSLRGKEGRLEKITGREAAVWVEGIRRHVPRDWLVLQGSTAQQRQPWQGQRSPVPAAPALAGPADPDAEGDDDPITEQAWYSLLEVCLELNLSPEEAQQAIAEAVNVPPDELDPSRLTWRQYLQAIERLEQMEPTP